MFITNMVTTSVYLMIIANWLATEDFNVGETGVSQKYTSKRSDVTLPDSISAPTPTGA